MSVPPVHIKPADVQRVLDKIEESNRFGDDQPRTVLVSWDGPDGTEKVSTSPYTRLRVRSSQVHFADGGFTDPVYAGIWFVVVAQPGAPSLPVFKTWDRDRAMEWATQMQAAVFRSDADVETEVPEC
ncbi:hypothetical protein [Kocuria sp.]|uniref:hypothetical protein n=1 Tax=Kocuria sp. TaxID=1871328 RepID=UPI0026DF611E|nr:hypothetical protein [Kocuria sp.]MDO5619303.1 hypothetical protein [Kocuria sp.]